jgi:hypothetical protein
VFLSVFAKSQPGENALKIMRNDDKTVDIRFYLFQITENRKPEINTLYVDIVEMLRQKTNFLSLENEEEYLIALARMLEAAVFQGYINHDAGQKILKLSGLLHIENDNIIISGQNGVHERTSQSISPQHIDTIQSEPAVCERRTCPLLEFSRRRMCQVQKVSSGFSRLQKQSNDGI